MGSGKGERFLSITQAVLLVLSAGLAVGIPLANLLQPDALAAATLWPVWSWLLPGWGLLALAWDRRRLRWILAVAAGWLLPTLLLAEETCSLLRPNPPVSPHRVRVVSFNCSTITETLAAELQGLRPDIVLLQEISLPQPRAAALARRILGVPADAACYGDCAVLARGKVVPQPAAWSYAHGRVTLPGQALPLHVYSVHLLPPVVRIDFWSPACWQEHARCRRAHRAQAVRCARALARLPAGTPIIFGGDLNVRQHDASLAPLRARLMDAFRQAGQGWGNTVLNDFPALRFDQVWVSPELRPLSVTARKSRSSDHRLVICDLAPQATAR